MHTCPDLVCMATAGLHTLCIMSDPSSEHAIITNQPNCTIFRSMLAYMNYCCFHTYVYLMTPL